MSSLTKVLAEEVRKIEETAAVGRAMQTNRLTHHLMPPTGWLNDPNGLCQRDGTYHVYHQWRPAWPDSPECVWGHATSRDLAHWEHRGCAIPVTLPEEEGGVWSGSAYLAEGAPMRVYYTANRKCWCVHKVIRQ